MSRFINDVTCDKIINTKGDNKKYRDNWDKIFGKSKEEMKEHVQQITGDVPHTVVANLNIEGYDKYYKPKYVVVVGWSKEAVLKMARENEPQRIFTLPFYTGCVEDVPDWSDLDKYNYHYLVQPFYVKGVEDIFEIVKMWGFE